MISGEGRGDMRTNDFGDDSWLADLGERPMQKTTGHKDDKRLKSIPAITDAIIYTWTQKRMRGSLKLYTSGFWPCSTPTGVAVALADVALALSEADTDADTVDDIATVGKSGTR
jgi:hypothetical protein